MLPAHFHTPHVFTLDEFLSPSECQQLIALAQQQGFEAAIVRTCNGEKTLPTIRNNERTLVENAAWVDLLWQRLRTIALPIIDGETARGLPKDLRFYKYSPGQRFKMHKDGPWTENGMTSRLTFLVYLNDGFVGGDTDFRQFRVQPRCGSALLFVHDTWHEGAAVVEGQKYVLRSDVLYAA